jgi:hypothetical protein
VAITANRKSSVCVGNMATAGQFAASSEEEIVKNPLKRMPRTQNFLRNPQSNVCSSIYWKQMPIASTCRVVDKILRI